MRRCVAISFAPAPNTRSTGSLFAMSPKLLASCTEDKVMPQDSSPGTLVRWRAVAFLRSRRSGGMRASITASSAPSSAVSYLAFACVKKSSARRWAIRKLRSAMNSLGELYFLFRVHIAEEIWKQRKLELQRAKKIGHGQIFVES
eukprot:5459637-Pleurochrysis_carterae.AAC.1